MPGYPFVRENDSLRNLDTVIIFDTSVPWHFVEVAVVDG